MSSAVAGRAARHGLWMGGAVLLVALNLRGPVVSLAPALDALRSDTGMSAAAAGLLVSIPVVCFGLAASVASRIARRLGTELTLVATMLVLAAGILIRLGHPVAAFFFGTAVLGLAVGVGNVVVPAVVKQEFPGPIGIMTGVYVTVMLGAGGAAAATTVPLMELPGVSLRLALAVWAVPALLAAAAWVPISRSRRRSAPVVSTATTAVLGLWRNPLAWQVTGFMALQSFGYYAIAGWVPTLFVDHGFSAETGGLLLAVASIACIPSALICPIVAERMRTQHFVVAAAVAVNTVGLLGLLLVPATLPALWVSLMGLGQGGTLALSLTLIGLRAADSRHAAQLSGMVQTVGYLLAAAGPLMVGTLHELTGGWTVPVAVLTFLMLPQLLAGLGAARPLHVGGR